MMKVSEADLLRRAQRIVDADALILALWVLLEGWTIARRLHLVRLASAAAVAPRAPN